MIYYAESREMWQNKNPNRPGFNIMLDLDHQDPDIFCREVSRLVDPTIREILSLSVNGWAHEPVIYQVASGGKRLRPALAIASCLACDGTAEDALYPAAGLEILHNCSLIYDDIIDNSSLRRGQSTAWCKFGKSIAQCVGLDYAAAIFQAANRSHHPLEISEVFAGTMKAVVEGEIRDIMFEQRGRDDEKYIVDNRRRTITLEDYLQMVSQKTASLMRASCEVGAISAGAEEAEREALCEYGFNLGVAFQIRDDILDIFGDEEEFGKKIGKDIEEGKLGNIVVLYAMEELNSACEHKALSTILRSDDVEDTDIEKALTLISKTRARDRASRLEEDYINKAKSSLQEVPSNQWRDLLDRLADFSGQGNR